VLGVLGNLHTHLYHVPVEILLLIFLFCDFAPVPAEKPITIAAAWKRARLLTSTASVCSRFHAVLSCASEFWNVIIFTPLGRRGDSYVLKRMIERSGERPVQVVWDCRGMRMVTCNTCVEALCSVEKTRIHSISIRLTSRGILPTTGVFEQRFRPLAMLRATRIECHEGCSEIPFVPSGASTTVITIASNHHRSIYNIHSHMEVNLPARLAITLVSLRLEVLIRSRNLNYYLSRCISLKHLEWVIPTVPAQLPLDTLPVMPEDDDYDENEEDRDHQPVLFLPKTVKTVVISHPFLVPVLHAPSITHARLDVHDHGQLQVTNLGEWLLDAPHVPRLENLWISCPCIALDGILDAMVKSAAGALERVNLGVQMHTPKGLLYSIHTFRVREREENERRQVRVRGEVEGRCGGAN
jgi:hypothetical protein